MHPILKMARIQWKLILFISLPLIWIPIPLNYPSMVGKAGYGVILMACYWTFEVLPIPVTSLLPMVIFPVLGVISADKLSKNYMKDGNMLILGSLLIASSVEKCSLHKRIALLVIKWIGTQRSRLMLGFMLPTYILSMWISNTATTAIMFPVAQAILEQFDTNVEKTEQNYCNQVNNEDIELMQNKDDVKVTVISTNKPRNKAKQFRKGLCLSIAYACNIGGTSTLIGTGTNVVFKQISDSLYDDHGVQSPITFASWIGFWLPGSFISVCLAWLWLQVQYVGIRNIFKRDNNPELTKRIKKVIDEEYEQLGAFSYAELMNSCAFGVLALLWITRTSSFIPGWISLFGNSYVRNSSCALLISIFLFVIPYHKPSLEDNEHKGYLLDWPLASKKVSWGVILLLGGGYALADVSKQSGLSASISERLLSFVDISPLVVAIMLTIVVSLLTEFTSNVATNALLLPILAEISLKMNLSPLYLMIHGTIASSFAFMLPIATPPNAIVFANGDLKIIDMIKSGVVMNSVLIIVLLIITNTWGVYYYDLNTVPWSTEALQNTTLPY